MKKIERVSRMLKWMVLGGCVSLPLIEAGYWMTDGYPFLKPYFTYALPHFGGYPLTWADLSQLQKFLGFLINLLPVTFSMAALFYLSQLFHSFEQLQLFEKKNVVSLKKAGLALLWGQLLYPFYTAFLSLILTYRNPVGQRNISVSLGADQVEVLVIALAILLVAWILEEAVKMREEQEATV